MSVLWSLLAPLTAQADDSALQWTKIDMPGLDGNIVSPSEVSEIAVGLNGTIYAIDSENSKVYRSSNAGVTWEDITSRLVDAGAVLPASKIAIAQDTTSMVAVVTNSSTKVYLSTDGGVTWTGTNIPDLAGTIQSIVISRQYTEAGESPRDIAIGTAAWGDNTTTGQLWVRQVGVLLSTWRNQSLTVDPGHIGGEVSAIAYSPNYPSDKTMIVVASTGNDVAASYQNKTWLCIGQRDTAAQTTSWGAFSGYPVEIAAASSPSAGDAVGASANTSLALPSDYSSADEQSRRLFVSYDRHPNASDDVYRFDDTTPHRLNANGGADIDISSIAYYGTTTSGSLLAGDASKVAGLKVVQVRRTSNPFDSSPTWRLASVLPSGPGNAKVSWNPEGDSAYCGTGQSPGAALDESAFSRSSDGDNWQQLSLIDAIITVSDIAPVPDSKTLLMATYSSFGSEGIWRSDSTPSGIGGYWYRLLVMDTTSNRIILRLSPEYASDNTIYAAGVGGNLIAVSRNGGIAWKQRRTPGGIIDVVVEDENTLYAAIPGGYIKKSTNGAFIWGEPVSTGLTGINMLAIAKKGTVLAGGRNGEVAYSTDGGASFTRIQEVLGTGDVQVVADSNYQKNTLIYAATDAVDKGIWRWTIGTSTNWEQIDESITTSGTGQRVGGLATGAEGTLYALRLESASSDSGGMTRSLNPAAENDAGIEFDFSSAGLAAGTRFDPTLVFSNTLPYLKISGDAGQNDLWAIDTANGIIYHFQDTMATKVPTSISPADSFQNRINAINGRSVDIAFSWNSPSRNVTDYELGIYADAACTIRIQLCPVSSTSDTPSVIIGPYQSRATGRFVEYTPGSTYYWRVRSTLPLRSPWSEVRSFTVEPVMARVLNLLSPANGAINASKTPSFSWEPVAGASDYRFLLADNPSLSTPIVDINVGSAGYAMPNGLEFGKTYFWAVKPVTPVEGGWSTVANFTVREKPAEPSPPIVVQEIPPPVINIPAAAPPPPEIVIPPYPSLPATIAPAYIWAIIIIATTLVIAVIILILRTRRPV